MPDVDEENEGMCSKPEVSDCIENQPSTSDLYMEGVTVGAMHMKRPHVCVMAISGGRLIRPLLPTSITEFDPLASIGTKFQFILNDAKRIRPAQLPHSHEDTPIRITWIDPKPIDSKQLHGIISSCGLSMPQCENSQRLVQLLASNQKLKKNTICVGR